MAAPAPTTAELMAIITQLQAQIDALQNASPAAAADPPAGAATLLFADTPQILGANDQNRFLDETRVGHIQARLQGTQRQGTYCGFAMTPNQTVIFVVAFNRPTTTMGWNQGARQITLFANSARCQVKIISSYGQVNEATLKSVCERFCKSGEVDSQARIMQNNTMMSICLAKLLTADAEARLLTYQNEYTFDGVEYSPLMYKIIIRLATVTSVTTTQMLRKNLQSLGVYVVTVSGNIDKVHNEFDKNYSQLIARGMIVEDPIGILFKAYLVAPYHNFKTYICHQHEDYLDGKLTTITHEALMTSTKHKFDWLKIKQTLGGNIPREQEDCGNDRCPQRAQGPTQVGPQAQCHCK
jgi:hypothetical protein